MSLPKFCIDPGILRVRPGTRLGVLAYRVGPAAPAESAQAFFDASVGPALRERLSSTELSAMPGIGDARRALKALGADPGRWRISSEALYRRIRQGKEFPSINAPVDAGNLVSLETGLSVGSYDRGLTGDRIVLRRGLPDETYGGIGRGSVPLAGIPVLCDEGGPFGSPVSDSPRAIITDATTDVFAVLYCFSDGDVLERAVELAADRLARFAGASDIEVLLVA